MNACRRAGLLPASKWVSIEDRQQRGFFRKVVSGINRFTQYFAWAFAAFSILYAIGWTWVHFGLGGPERDIQVVTADTLAVSDDWLDVANNQWSKDVTVEQNAAAQIVKLINPLRDNMNDYYQRIGLSTQEIKSLKQIAKPDRWFDGRISDYRISCRKCLGNLLTDEMESDERLWVEYLANRFEKDIFKLAPWNREQCSLAADYIDAYQTEIVRLREVANLDYFFSPWLSFQETGPTRTSDIGSETLRPALDLLEMSAMYRLGMKDVEGAMKDCLAISRLTRPEFTCRLKPKLFYGLDSHELRCFETAVKIAHSGLANRRQLERLLEMVSSRPEIEPSEFDKDFRKAMHLRIATQRFLQTQTNLTYFDPILSWYQANPSSIDWICYRSVFEKYLNAKIDLVAEVRRGEFRYKVWEERILFSLAEGTRM
ncbi:MAG: hypothetical protein AAGA30_20660, partial [Planctomycetota bacterium]